MSWCTSKSKVTRVMVLDFLFLCTALLTAQTKPVIERMSARIAEWQKAPTERFVGFEVAFPASPEEAKALANNAFVLVTCVSSKREEASISTAYVIRGDEQLAPTSLSPVRLGTSGFFRSDRLYAVP